MAGQAFRSAQPPGARATAPKVTSDTPAPFCFDLSDRVVLVTGASSGIGGHLAVVLARSGARVALAARRMAELDAKAAEIRAAGGQAIAVRLDVTDEPSTIAAYDAVEAAFGSVDTVIANAGMSVPGSAMGLAMEDFDQIVAVNLRGTFLTVREAARRMVAAGSPERGHGRIVIVSSITAQQISPGMAVYSATKAAVTQMGRVLARDWATKGINVNVVAPGYISTDLNDGYFDTAAGARLKSRFARDRIMDVDALDAMLLYLASTASAQTTGSVFTLDDGQSL